MRVLAEGCGFEVVEEITENESREGTITAISGRSPALRCRRRAALPLTATFYGLSTYPEIAESISELVTGVTATSELHPLASKFHGGPGGPVTGAERPFRS
jgi:hypothetical protein